jgi:hypothetical protein
MDDAFTTLELKVGLISYSNNIFHNANGACIVNKLIFHPTGLLDNVLAAVALDVIDEIWRPNYISLILVSCRL